MFGSIIRLDAGRQARVGTNQLQQLLSPDAYLKACARRQKLIASAAAPLPFAPTLVRPSMYPDYFRATDIRTLYWKIRNFDGLHSLSKVYVDEHANVIFEFPDAVQPKTAETLASVLRHFGHMEFIDPVVADNRITYKIDDSFYDCSEAGGL